jgi:hypothetical protein
LWIADEVKQPAEESKAITAAKAEPCGERRQGIHEGAWVVDGTSDGVGDDMCHSFGLLTVEEEVGRDSGGSRRGKTAESDTLGAIELAVVETDIGSP